MNNQMDSNIITQAKLDLYIDDAGNTAVSALDLMFFYLSDHFSLINLLSAASCWQGRTGHLDVLEKSRPAVHPAAVGLAGSSSKKKCQMKRSGLSINTNSAHQRVIGLVNITKDS